MGNQSGLGIHFVFLSLLSAATTNTCLGLGSPNITLGCNEQEGLALLKFKQSVIDYNRLSSWVGTDCCLWEGVKCDAATGSVVGLYLSSRLDSLIGQRKYFAADEVNSALLELRHLKYLDLSGNAFFGCKIPEFIGSLKHLNHLNLSSAGFYGVIPHHIGNLSNLKVLDLNSNFLQADDMAWISGLSTLEYLHMSRVNLSLAQNLDKVLYMIPSLIELSLSDCHISDANLAGHHLNSSRMLPNIRRLDLSRNAFEGKFPSRLMNLSSLLSLDLSRNIINSSILVMPSLVELQLCFNNVEHIELSVPLANASESSKYALEILDVCVNHLKGSIPNFLSRLANLRELVLSSNKLEGPIPEALGKLRLLEVFDVSSNQLSGPIPTFLGQLTELRLSRNRLNGTIPESLGRLTTLIQLDLESNQLTGAIPTSLGRLASLQTFSASSNMLNGTIPVSFGKLKKLYSLDISNNSLVGIVSESHFANLSMLEGLDISSNNNLTFNVSHRWIPPFQAIIIALGSSRIANEFPQWIRTQKKLKILLLSNTSIYGPLPNWLQNMTSISTLDLSHNKLNGSLKNLAFQNGLLGYGYGILLLRNNNFHGSIPRSLCSCKYLVHLDLSRNSITGNVPNCLADMFYLRTIILSSNRMSGVIPSFLGDHPQSLLWLNLNDNNFTGEIPRDIGNLTSLRVLDIGDNKFSGTIPESIGELTTLVVLRLHSNNFSGRIPPSLCKNSNLQILDVANNSLTGPIPRCFKELIGMIKGSPIDVHNGSLSPDVTVIQVIKGVVLEYTTTLQLVINMDLSSNKLVGEIHEELMTLSLLVGLNLSHNHLSGGIPNSIGNMKALNSLDFSYNNLMGRIPSSMAALNFLSHLNLSHNNFSGRIPTGNQLQTLLDPSIYAGNRDLCGIPLPKNCSNLDQVQVTTTSEDEYKPANEPKKIWFYLDIMCGFATGFWGVIGVLWLNDRLRQKVFKLGEVVIDKVYVVIMVQVAKMKRRDEDM